MANLLSIQPVLRTLVVKHPATGEPVGLDIEYRSLDSPEVQAVERVLKNKALRSGRNTPSVDKLEEGEYALMHAAIASWKWYNDLDLDGDRAPKLTRENTERVFRSVPWIKKQFNLELGDEQGFFMTAQSSSSTASSGASDT